MMGVDVFAARTPAMYHLSSKEGHPDRTRRDERAFRRAGIVADFCGWDRWIWVRDLFFRFHPDDDALTDWDQSDVGLEWIPSQNVRKIARVLEELDDETLMALDLAWDLDADQIDGLRQFFRVCARRGLGLVKWS